MPYDIEVNREKSTIIIDLHAPFKPQTELPSIHTRLANLAQNMDRPIYRIYDFTSTKLDFSTLVELLQHDTQIREGSASDWRFVPMCVGGDAMSKQYAESLSQEQYGGKGARLFRTREGAWQHIDQLQMQQQ